MNILQPAATMPSFLQPSAMGYDCCSFTFGAIHAVTGKQVGRQFAGRYSTKREALVEMKKLLTGRPSLGLFVEKLMREHGFGRIPVAFGSSVAIRCSRPMGMRYFFGIMDLNGRDVLSVGEHGVRRIAKSVRAAEHGGI